MKKLLFFIFFVFLSFSATYAVKAYPGLIEIIQPDGSSLNVYLHGDENFSYMTTEDGYLLKYNDLGFVEYAQLKSNNVIELTGLVAHNINSRAQIELDYLKSTQKVDCFREKLKNIESIILEEKFQTQYANSSYSNEGFPLKGSPKSLVILVNFDNLKFKSPTANADFTRMLNQYNYAENSATGSARDYFRTSSNGVFEPNFVVVGPYDLPQVVSYYGRDSGGRIDEKAGNLIVDACNAADPDVDFTEYDTNGDGYIDNVFVYYAGYNQAEGAGDNTVWPHRSAIMTEIYYDGVRIYDYACTSEFRSNKGAVMCGIGTFCHEFGHVLSLPDLYATNNATHATMGSWDIMDHGSYNNNGRTPPTYSAYERFYLGWLTPVQLSDGGYNLEPIALSNRAYIIADTEHNLDGKNPNPKEFFLIENRHNKFEHDGVQANGLLITHVNYAKSRWNSNVVNNYPDDMGVEIVCAFGSTAQPYQNVFPGSMQKTSVALTKRDGTMIDSLSSIVQKDSVISFVYGRPDFVPTLEVIDKIEDFVVDFGESAIKTLEIKADGIVSGDLTVSLAIGENYGLRLNSSEDTAFVKSLTLTPDNGSVHLVIDVKFSPKVYSILSYFSDNILISTNFACSSVAVRGKSIKPILVVPPVAYEAKDITPYAFTASWGEVYDATSYYLSVYSLNGDDTLYVKNNEFLVADSLKNGLSCSITNLKEATTYYYRLRSSDKDLFNGLYENITDYSNEISVTTLPGFGAESRKLDIMKKDDKYEIYLPIVDENHSIFIYSIDGRFITSVPVYTNVVELPQLQSNCVYILKYASNDALKRKSKVIKFYYE
ncbi:MAG: M6 family metalloprotease domain-containing protein [Paludibacteraceae bacterium]|nr:M6 family metalloprotease domain-containing protein [Paludibacteraceae bacterium]